MNSSQIIAAVAITAVLAAGAYALGRSQGTPAAPEAPATAAAVAAVEAPKLAMVDAKAETPTQTPASTSEPAASPALVTQAPATPAPVSLCSGCLRVVGVHAEQRKSESGSGAGAVGGAVLGGLLGNRVGGGTGRKLATLGGAVAGGFAGNEIEKNVNKKTVWIVELKSADGHIRHREQSSDPQLQVGDVVSIRDGHLVRR